MNRQTKLGGTFTLPGTSLNLYRIGKRREKRTVSLIMFLQRKENDQSS